MLNNFSKALGLGNQDQQNPGGYSNHSMQANNQMVMQQPQYNTHNSMQYKPQQQMQPMQHQQQRNMQVQGYQQQQPQHQQSSMMQSQQNQQQYRGQPMQQNMTMGGGWQPNQQQQQQGMYNSSGGMYNNQPQQMGRQQQQQPMQQNQGYLSRQNTGNYMQQPNNIGGMQANHMDMSQQRMGQQHQPNMMMHQQQPNRFAPSYGVEQQFPMQSSNQFPYEPNALSYGNSQAPMIQQQHMPPIQLAQPDYSTQNTAMSLHPTQGVQSLQSGYVLNQGGQVQPAPAGIVVAAPPQPTLTYLTQPPPQPTVLNPLTSATSYVALQQPTSTLLSQPQPQVVTASQPSSILIQPAPQPIPIAQQPQATSLILSSAPQAPTFTTAQLQAAAAAAVSAALGHPNQPNLGQQRPLNPATLTPQQQQLFYQMQLQYQTQHLKRMRQRMPHVNGDELRTLQKQMSDLQQMQQMQQLQTFRLAQKQEQQTIMYLNKAIKNRPNQTYQPAFPKFQGRPSLASSAISYPRDTSHFSAASLLTGATLGMSALSLSTNHAANSVNREHEKQVLEGVLPPDLRHLVRGGSPSTIQQIKSKLDEEMKLNSTSGAREADVARRNAERRLFGVGSLTSQTERIRQEMQRYASMRDPVLRAKMKHNLNPVMNAQLDRNRRLRAQLHYSDPRFSTSLTDSMGEDDYLYNRPYSALSSQNYDSDNLGLDNSRSYLGRHSFSGPDGISTLRDYSSTNYDLDRNRYLASTSQPSLRRSSDGGVAVLDSLSSQNFDMGVRNSPLASRRAQSSLSGHYSRSWHPSPFASDDEDALDEAQFFKHEKRNDIKMEIARRRQQVEETGCLQDELTRLDRLRDNPEIYSTTAGITPSGILSRTRPSMMSSTTQQQAGGNVLKSVNDILHVDHTSSDLGTYGQKIDPYTTTTGSTSRVFDTTYPSYSNTTTNPTLANYTNSGYSLGTEAYLGSTYDGSLNHTTGNHLMGDMMNSSRPLQNDVNSYTNAVGGGYGMSGI